MTPVDGFESGIAYLGFGTYDTGYRGHKEHFLLIDEMFDRVVGLSEVDSHYSVIRKSRDDWLSLKCNYDSDRMFRNFYKFSHVIEAFATMGEDHLRYNMYLDLLQQAGSHIEHKQFIQLCTSNGLDEKQRAQLTLPNTEHPLSTMQEDPKDMRGRRSR